MIQHFHIGIKALFLNDKGEILVLRKNPSHGNSVEYWDLPGGRMEQGAGIEDTLKREIEEEMGVKDFRIIKLFDANMANTYTHGDGKTRLLLVTYLCKLGAGKPISLDSEHTEYKWAGIKETKGLLAFKFPKSFLDKLDSLAVSGD